MDFVMGSALIFKCIFYYDFILIFFNKDSIYYIWWEKKYGLKELQKNNLTNK